MKTEEEGFGWQVWHANGTTCPGAEAAVWEGVTWPLYIFVENKFTCILKKKRSGRLSVLKFVFWPF